MSELTTFPFPVGTETLPPPQYEGIRAEKGLRRVAINGRREALLVTRYQDVRFVLADQRFSRLEYSRSAMPGVPRESLPLVTTDPPDHTRRRKAVAHAFTRHRVRAMQGMVEEVVAEAVHAIATGPRPVDLVKNFNRPITMVIMCRVLGLPEKDQDLFEHWGELTMSAGRHPVSAMVAAHQEMHAYFEDLVTARQEAVDRGHPGDDVLSHMLTSRHPERQVSRAETVSQISGIFYAGYESTSSQMGSSVFELLRRPEVLAELRTRPERTVPIVEELLRYLTIAQNGGMHHVATEDIELPDGSVVREGEIVIPIPDAANRDPEVFERPDELDVHRASVPHMAFGHGLHYCVGSELARMELQLALGALLRRLPTLELAVPEGELRWREDMLVRGLWELPVTW